MNDTPAGRPGDHGGSAVDPILVDMPGSVATKCRERQQTNSAKRKKTGTKKAQTMAINSP
jgi:membrane protein involved in colicin uptake